MWVCVAVFIITAFAAVLQLFGVRLIRDPRRDAQLFKIIIAAVAVAAVSAFASGIQKRAIDTEPKETINYDCNGNNPPLECYSEK